MKSCNSATVYKASYKSGEEWAIRLNISEWTEEGAVFSQKKIRTHLPATPRNKTKANIIAEQEIEKYNDSQGRKSMLKFFDEWLAWKKDSIELSTYQSYEYRIAYMRDYFKHVNVEEVTPAMVKDFYKSVFNQKKKTGDGYISNRVIKDVLKLFRNIMDDAVYMKLIPENPCGKLKIPQRPTAAGDKAFIGADEVEIFFEEIKGHKLEDMFVLAIYYGLRREELCALKWDAVRGDEIFIERTIVHVKTDIAKERTKTQSSYRSYPITEPVREMLDRIKEKQERDKKFFGDEYKDSGYIFTWNDGHPYSPDYLTKSFKKLVKKSDRLDDSLTLHSLRASCVSILVHGGADIKDIQKWVGHADIKTTLQIYARTNKKQQWGVANKMDGFIFQGQEGKSKSKSPEKIRVVS